MRNRREFLKTAAGVVPLLAVARSGAAGQAAPDGRRRVTIAGRRVTVVDIHAHCVIPVSDVVKGMRSADAATWATSSAIRSRRHTSCPG